jgi:hypothetical protein
LKPAAIDKMEKKDKVEGGKNIKQSYARMPFSGGTGKGGPTLMNGKITRQQ